MPEQPTDAMSEPQYINEVEQVIGVRFFPEPYSEWAAHNDLSALSLEAQYTYAGVYVGGLRLLADARRYYDLPRDQPFSLTSDQLRETRVFFTEERERLVHHLRLVARVVERLEGAKPTYQVERELKISELVLSDIVEDLNSVLVTKKRGPKVKFGTLYFPEDELLRIEEVVRQIPDIEPGAIRAGQLMKRLQLTEEELYEAMRVTDTPLLHRRLPAGDYAYAVSKEDAAILVEYVKGSEEKQVIIPYEYLTIDEYAHLRKVDRSGVYAAIKRHGLPTHHIKHGRPTYLDGATMYYLDRLRTPLGAPEGYITLKELVTFADSRGYNPTSLDDYLRRGQVPTTQILLGDRTRLNVYSKKAAMAVVAKLPKRYVPLSGITAVELAAFYGVTPHTIRERLRRIKSRTLTAGKYMTADPSGRGYSWYYLKEELLAAGIQVPSTPAFPAGERPYGPYGPARAQPKPRSAPTAPRRPSTRRRKEEAFTIEAKSTPVARKEVRPYAPGSTLRKSEQPDGSLVGQYRTDMSQPPVRIELAASSASATQEPQHAIDEPGTWAQSAPMPIDRFISVMEKLSTTQIAERLGIEEDVVREAITRVDPGSASPEMITRKGRRVALYGDRLLVAIREQLVGIPLGYISIKLARKLTEDQLAHARRLLRRQGYEAFEGDRYSPGAIEYLSQHIATILATTEISDE